MSWAAHNPEKYDELCREGMANILVENPDTITWMLDQLQIIALNDDGVKELLDDLMDQSRVGIDQAIGNYFAGGN